MQLTGRGGTWWLYARVGDAEKPQARWKRPYATEAEVRRVAQTMRARTEAAGDTWSEFNSG